MEVVNSLWVIDDDFLFRTCTEVLLKEANFASTIHLVDGAVNALKELNEIDSSNDISPPELILLDINMPEMNAWGFLDYVLANGTIDFSKTSIYILSSSIDPRDKKKAKSYEILSGFVHKPLTPDSIEDLKETKGD